MASEPSEVQSPTPEASYTGTAQLVLDSGQVFHVHADLLELSSSTLAEALATARGRSSGAAPSLHLPGVTGRQAIILLQALYAMPSAVTWASAQPATDLLELASVCHALACARLLHLAQDALVKQAHACITKDNAIKLYYQARQLDMSAFQQECAVSIVKLLPELKLDQSAGNEGLLPILRGFRDLRSIKASRYHDADMLELLAHLNALPYSNWDVNQANHPKGLTAAIKTIQEHLQTFLKGV